MIVGDRGPNSKELITELVRLLSLNIDTYANVLSSRTTHWNDANHYMCFAYRLVHHERCKDGIWEASSFSEIENQCQIAIDTMV